MGKITVMKKMIIFYQHFGNPIVLLWAISPDEKQELITWANKTIITKEMVVGQNGS